MKTILCSLCSLLLFVVSSAQAELVTNTLAAGRHSLETGSLTLTALRTQNTNGVDVTLRIFDAPSTNLTYTISKERKNSPGINDAEPNDNQNRAYRSRVLIIKPGVDWFRPENSIQLKNGLLITNSHAIRIIYQK